MQLKAELSTFWHYYAQFFHLKQNVNVDLRKALMHAFLEQRRKEATLNTILLEMLQFEDLGAKA